MQQDKPVLVYACAKHIGGATQMSDHICLFQVIMDEHKSEPLRVLEEQFLPADQCSLEVAKVEFMQRYEDRAYLRRHSVLWPDAVRFLDQRGDEVVRYTAWNYLRDITTKERDQAARPGQGPALGLSGQRDDDAVTSVMPCQ